MAGGEDGSFDINNPSKYQEASAKFTINEILNKYPESNGKEFAIQSFYLRSKSIGTVFGNPQHIKGTYVTIEDGKEVINEVDEICKGILENTAVFKNDDIGQLHFDKYLNSINTFEKK